MEGILARGGEYCAESIIFILSQEAKGIKGGKQQLDRLLNNDREHDWGYGTDVIVAGTKNPSDTFLFRYVSVCRSETRNYYISIWKNEKIIAESISGRVILYMETPSCSRNMVELNREPNVLQKTLEFSRIYL